MISNCAKFLGCIKSVQEEEGEPVIVRHPQRVDPEQVSLAKSGLFSESESVSFIDDYQGSDQLFFLWIKYGPFQEPILGYYSSFNRWE